MCFGVSVGSGPTKQRNPSVGLSKLCERILELGEGCL